ncbi:hypothetical protein FLA_0045 [Filimonas lacunae]|nr:hypothetical protein FLA_0045 [Filimonas lacunae]
MGFRHIIKVWLHSATITWHIQVGKKTESEWGGFGFARVLLCSDMKPF